MTPQALEKIGEYNTGSGDLVWPGAKGWTERRRRWDEEEALKGHAALIQAVWGLAVNRPQDSAHIVMTRGQKRWALVFLGIAVAASALWPVQTLAGALIAMSAFNVAVAAFRYALALSAPEPAAPTQAAARRRYWPSYTVMVPLFKEAHIVPDLIDAIGRLRYPHDRIEIFLVCEGDDHPTIAAAEGAERIDRRFRVIKVPPCEPRTKPKALNYALAFAKGSLCVIFDAEDRPDPDQLKLAAARFLDGPADLACLQARLNWYNRADNWLTRAFALEYALWFDYLLPGLERLGAPIPLGGTSNHFKTEALRACGAWDPFNVTEDADLGLRLMRRGGTVGTLDSTTLEEATNSAPAWIRQRSRWIKGYMQTWLVQMRDPGNLWRAGGVSGFVAFQLFVGGVVLTALINPILWLLTIAAAAGSLGGGAAVLPDAALISGAAGLLLGNALLIHLNMLCAIRRGWFELVPAALATPVYWVLISAAGYRALGQLIRNPFYWEKTDHGVGKPHDA